MGRLFPNLFLEEYQEKAFYNALKTKGFAILAGLSGTGKTRIFDELVDNFYQLELPKVRLNASLSNSIGNFINYYGKSINSKSLTGDNWHYMVKKNRNISFDEGGGIIETTEQVSSLVPSIIFDLLYVDNENDIRIDLKKFCRKYLDFKEIDCILIKKKKDEPKYEPKFDVIRRHFGICLDDNHNICYRDDIKGNTDDEKLKEINRQLYGIKRLSEAGHFLPIIKEDSQFNAFSLPVRKIFAFIFNPNAWMYIFDKDEINKLSESLFGLSVTAIKLKLEKVEIPSLFFPIRPDFRDSKSLIGYYNPLDGSYHSTELLDFILEAQREYVETKKAEGESENKAEGGKNGERKYARPYFVLLDEMNLARVEYYFAYFLSVLESRRIDEEYIENNKDNLKEMKKNLGLSDREDDAIKGFYSAPILLYSENDVTSKKKSKIPQKLYIPPNLYFVGTVNIDETTHMFSPKVLDRAFTLEFDSNIKDYESYLKNYFSPNKQKEQRLLIVSDFTRYFNYAKIDTEYIKIFLDMYTEYSGELININDILKPYSLHFGNRVYNEIIMYVGNAINGIHVVKKPASAGNNNLIEIDGLDIEEFSTCDEAFDLAVRMKILPKFHGTKQALEVPIMKLIGEFCEVETADQQGRVMYFDKDKNLYLDKKTEEPDKKTEEPDKKTEELNISEMPVLEVDKSSGVPKLKISGNEYTAKYPHTTCKLFEMLYKLRTNGFASFL